MKQKKTLLSVKTNVNANNNFNVNKKFYRSKVIKMICCIYDLITVKKHSKYEKTKKFCSKVG